MNPWKKLALPGLVCSALMPAGCGTVAPWREAKDEEASKTAMRAIDEGLPAIVQASATTDVSEKPDALFASDTILDLGGALELAGVDSPTINLAREAVREAIARQEMAEAMWLPSLLGGANVRVHRGNLQQGTGGITNVDTQGLFFGSGAWAVGSGTVTIPGVRLFYPLADTILEPRAAREQVMSRGADSVGVRNATMLEVTTAYLELVAANASLNALRLSEAEFAELSRLTEDQAKVGQGRSGDANRAKANLEMLRRQIKEAEGEQLAATARLAGLLSLDPSGRLSVPTTTPAAVRLFAEETDLDSLMGQSLLARPEIAARSADVAEANTRWRQESLRPWLPTISLGFSAGGFGGGSTRTTSSFGSFDSRTDLDVYAVWTLRNAGAGNRALQQQTMARIGQTTANLEGVRQQVKREVSEAYAQLTAAASRMATAKTQLATAEDGYAAEKARTKQPEWRPLEAIDSARQLQESRLEMIRAITDHNLAQFRLLVAVGRPPVP
ncbi:TolC family protein [Zavarzinella formosa]|uniref:TolC family protein n=1 Tax=Zavarzinella formosa TaxID=360055 RepID=UPI00036BFDBD|nr:TolC family protein [Zavarzinella formosa]